MFNMAKLQVRLVLQVLSIYKMKHLEIVAPARADAAIDILVTSMWPCRVEPYKLSVKRRCLATRLRHVQSKIWRWNVVHLQPCPRESEPPIMPKTIGWRTESASRRSDVSDALAFEEVTSGLTSPRAALARTRRILSPEPS